MAQPRYNFAEWWHLLSLDAPTVAGLWSWFFARALSIHLPLLAPLLLALGTWLVYVADRILDGLIHPREELLRERHIFHARHRRFFLTVAFVLTVFLLWMILTRMYPKALHEDIILAVFAFLYLILVHFKRASAQYTGPVWLPKELTVGILFAAATAVPAWSRMSAASSPARGRLAMAVCCFAALCWINCVAIEKWESVLSRLRESEAGDATHSSTRWAAAHLQGIVTVAGLFSLAAACFAPTRGIAAVYFAAVLSSALLLVLDACRARLSPLSLRIAADAALLTPLAFLPMLR